MSLIEQRAYSDGSSVVDLNRVSLIASALIFSLLSSSLVIHDGVGVSAGLLLILSLICYPFIKHRVPLETIERWWVATLVLSFFSGVISFFVKDVDMRELNNLDVSSRFVLVIPVFLMLRLLPLKPGAFWFGMVVGPLFASVYALHEKINLGVMNAHGGANHHIPFGDVALTMGFMSLAGFSYFKQFKWGWLLPIIGVLGGLIASALSGARGGWIAIPVLSVLLIWVNKRYLSRWAIVVLILLPVGLGSIVYHIPATNVKNRVDTAVVETKKYFNTGNHHGSVNHRYEMFKAAWLIYKDNPMLGAGTDSFRQEAHKLWEQGEIKKIGKVFTHPHNDFLSAMAMRGTLGLLATVFLFLCPLFYLVPLLRTVKVSQYAIAGLVLNIAYVHFALSEAILDRMFSLMFYLFVSAILFALIRSELSKNKV